MQNDVNLKILRKEEIEASKVKELDITTHMVEIRIVATKDSKVLITLLGNGDCKDFSFEVRKENYSKYLIFADSKVSGLVLEIKIPAGTNTNRIDKIAIMQDNSKTEIQSFVYVNSLSIDTVNSKVICYANFKELLLDILATKVKLSLYAQQDIKLAVFSKDSNMDFNFDNVSINAIMDLSAKNVLFQDNHKTVGPYKVYGILDLEDSSFTFN